MYIMSIHRGSHFSQPLYDREMSWVSGMLGLLSLLSCVGWSMREQRTQAARSYLRWVMKAIMLDFLGLYTSKILDNVGWYIGISKCMRLAPWWGSFCDFFILFQRQSDLRHSPTCTSCFTSPAVMLHVGPGHSWDCHIDQGLPMRCCWGMAGQLDQEAIQHYRRGGLMLAWVRDRPTYWFFLTSTGIGVHQVLWIG
jgi:hypothetical protein